LTRGGKYNVTSIRRPVGRLIVSLPGELLITGPVRVYGTDMKFARSNGRIYDLVSTRAPIRLGIIVSLERNPPNIGPRSIHDINLRVT
jgi:hypothetical protein